MLAVLFAPLSAAQDCHLAATLIGGYIAMRLSAALHC